MSSERVVVVSSDMVTPYGRGVNPCWTGLMSGKTAIKKFDRFSTEHFQSNNAAVIADLKPDANESLVMQMLKPLFKVSSSMVPPDALLILATTIGEIDILEKHVLDGSVEATDSRLDYLLIKVERLCGVDNPGIVISAACASSSIAIAQAAAMIRNGKKGCVLVVSCDSVSEFVFSGFSTINALDKYKAKPFDKNRSGLSLGEAAGFVLLMSESRALRDKREMTAEVAGWGLSNDANHITGPSRDGAGLSFSIQKALESADIPPDVVGSISAHGTGTLYNDSMEMKAFKSVFHERAIPTYSIKGGIGHTLGSAGLIEMIIALQSVKEKAIPPNLNIDEVDEEASGWVSRDSVSINSPITISTNSGFGGINVALVLRELNGKKNS